MIGGGVQDLVEQLLLTRGDAHRAARARHLGEHRAAIARDFGQRKAEPGKVRHLLAIAIGEIAAAQLPRTFQEVADQRRAADLVRIVERPAEGVREGSGEQRGIADTAGDHHIRTLAEGTCDRLAAEIGVGREDAGEVRRGARPVEQEEGRAFDCGTHVIAEHRGDAERRQPHLTR